MHSITITTDTADKLVFELSFDRAYALATPYGIDDPSDMLDLYFYDAPADTVTTYDLTVFFKPYYFATRLTHNGYGSDCADYDSIDDIAYAFGQPAADFVTAELTRRGLPLVASRF